jgi:hypothetical protein
MPRKPIDLPPAAARRFFEDMRAFFKETNQIKQDEIAARQLHALRHYYIGKLRLTDVKEMFVPDEGPGMTVWSFLLGSAYQKII